MSSVGRRQINPRLYKIAHNDAFLSIRKETIHHSVHIRARMPTINLQREQRQRNYMRRHWHRHVSGNYYTHVMYNIRCTHDGGISFFFVRVCVYGTS